MDILQELEIQITLFLQSLGTWLVEPMRFFSMLGYEEFFMLIMPSIFWCFDTTVGIRMAVMLLVCNASNSMFKLSFHTPRPYWVSTQVQAYTTETGFGLPSGHAQTAAGLWGALATSLKQRWAKTALVLVIFLIGLSRLYLGVHFVRDVLAGWLIGGLLLAVYLKIERPVTNWLRRRTFSQQILLAFASAIVLALMILIPRAALGDWQYPSIWQENAFIASPDNTLTPFKIDGAFTFSGTWFGLFAGLAWLYRRQGGFDPSGTPRQRLLRYVIGVAGILVLWFVLGQIFPREENVLSYALRFVRYTLVGLWVSAIAPLVFARTGLVNTGKVTVPPLSAK